MRRVLLVSPHFPPDASAGAHRARVVAPYLADHGWRPTVLTVHPDGYEGALDDELWRSIEGRVEVVRVDAWRPGATRRLGIGDLGLRSVLPLFRAARHLPADAVIITTYPVYPAVIGPRLRKTRDVPFVLDLQDPWVGEWGRSVGGGPGGRPDLKSRVSRGLADRIERQVVPEADALTSVSSGLLDELAERYPVMAGRPRLSLPIGIDPADLDWVASRDHAVASAPPADGNLHVCYVGTLLPLGYEVLDTVLAALGDINGGAGPRVQLHLVGTSNQADAQAAPRADMAAARAGARAWVHETPGRIPYFDALRALRRASIALVMGTTEGRYTASKVQAALASGRPLLAVVHADSDVARVLAPLASRDEAIALVTYTDERRAATCVGAVTDILTRWRRALPERRADTRYAPGATGPELAAALAALLDQVTRRPAAARSRAERGHG